MRILTPLLVLLVVNAPAYAQTGITTSGATSAVNITNPSNITSRLVTPPTVVAPGLAAAGIETCLGSASGGLSLMGTGVTFGGTVSDPGCSIRLTARQLHAFGYHQAALSLLCQDPRVAEAMATVGQPCPVSVEAARERRRVGEYPTGSSDRSRSAALRTSDVVLEFDEVSRVKPFTAEEARWFARDTPR
jgi:hypothetical protein